MSIQQSKKRLGKRLELLGLVESTDLPKIAKGVKGTLAFWKKDDNNMVILSDEGWVWFCAGCARSLVSGSDPVEEFWPEDYFDNQEKVS